MYPKYQYLPIIERIKKNTYWILFVLSIIVVFLLVILCIYGGKNSTSICSKLCSLISSPTFWSMISAIATSAAAILAYCAYRQSVRMRKFSSFDSLFTQLLSNMQIFINSSYLQTTRMERGGAPMFNFLKNNKINISCYNKNRNTFLNFCSIYKKYANNNSHMLDENKINQLWQSYTNSLVNQSCFLNCFKYFYHMVTAVIDSPLDEEYKKKYIGIIQSQLNLDILFCYLINLIAVYQGKEAVYCSKLKQYEFFKNLFEDHDGYGKLINSTIHVYLIEKIH